MGAVAKERKNIYFLSDLHLGSRCLDRPREAEKRVVAFLDSIKDDAAEIYLVGDILDYWFEYRCVVPRGFVRFFGKIAELSDMGIKITWFTGNHDIWIFDYLPGELGVELVNGAVTQELSGRRFFIEHGDGIGERPRKERLMRGVFRSRICQRLFSAIHPRWTVPFAFGWSKSNRKKHHVVGYRGAGREPLIRFAKEYLAKHKIDYFIFGHRHILMEERIKAQTPEGEGREATVCILGEWIETCSYAMFDGEKFTVGKFNHTV